jgi:beta-lactam-binding protein with PASTA domain
VVVYEIQEAVWAPVHLRTPAALGVSQSYQNYAQVLVEAAVPGGFTVEVVFPSNAVEVPDLSDDTLASAERTVTEVGLSLRASGSGFVVAQRPAAGTSVPKGSVVQVTLRPGLR